MSPLTSIAHKDNQREESALFPKGDGQVKHGPWALSDLIRLTDYVIWFWSVTESLCVPGPASRVARSWQSPGVSIRMRVSI